MQDECLHIWPTIFFLRDSSVGPFLEAKSGLELAQNKQNFLQILDAKILPPKKDPWKNQ